MLVLNLCQPGFSHFHIELVAFVYRAVVRHDTYLSSNLLLIPISNLVDSNVLVK